MRKVGSFILLAAATLALMGGTASSFLLSPSEGASWIRLDKAADLLSKSDGSSAVFRRLFRSDRSESHAVVPIRSLGSRRVFLDGRPLLPAGTGDVDLGPRLDRGEHELRVEVSNPEGPAVIWASGRSLGLATGVDWEASSDGRVWSPARPAEDDWEVPISDLFPRPREALLKSAPLLLTIFVLVFWWALSSRPAPSPGAMRWLILSAWMLLGFNNILRIPRHVGFDVMAHMRYLQTIALHGRLPLADEGWQTFQAPLYYIVSAPLWNALSALFGFQQARFWIRVVPLVCGALQTEMAYRAARVVFPPRVDLQRVAIVVGGLLPMNLYMSQSAGNEPMAGIFSAGVVLLGLSFRSDGSVADVRRRLLVIGSVLGLALLTKVNALLLVPPLLLLLAQRLTNRTPRSVAALSAAGVVLGAAFAVSGWHYVRNIVHGIPLASFLSSASASWWQDPGYRTSRQILSFGQALVRPVFSGFHGFWDSIYSSFWLDGYLSGIAKYEFRPGWNYDLMIAGAWLSLLPAAFIIIGFFSILAEPARSVRSGLAAVAGWVSIYLCAVFFVWLRLPVYSAAKASYMLGLTPCFALLAARGLEGVADSPLLRAVIHAALACWAVDAYLSYFVLTPIVSFTGG